MDDILRDFGMVIPYGTPASDMIVVSNKSKMYGAVNAAVTQTLRSIAESTESSMLYILPSSVHEVIVLPEECHSGIEVRGLIQMVKEINASQVAPRDRLSDSVYIYTRETDTLTPYVA